MNKQNPLQWNYQVVFQLPPQVYYTTYTLPDVEQKLNAMKEYKDALAVIDKIKSL